MKRNTTLAFVIFAALGASACSLPEVALKDAMLTKLTQRDMEIGLNLEVFNPNDYALPLQMIDWDLDLFRADFTNGETAFSRNIPAGRRAPMTVPIGINFQSVAVGVQNLITNRQIPWGIGGGASFRVPTQDPVRVGFSHSGSWNNPLFSSR